MRTKKTQDTYGEPVIMQIGNCTARVYHPILTEEERERRMNALKKGCSRFMLAWEESRQKAKKEEEQKKEELGQ